MKGLLKILLPGLAAFIVVAMAQEWRIFASAWFGSAASARALPDEDRSAASEAVRRYLSLASHLHGTGGDRRFAERIPAAPEVVEELVADVVFTRHFGRREEHRLVQLEVRDARPAGEDRVEVLTREYWVIRAFNVTDASPVGPGTSEIVHAKYLVSRQGASWRVSSWELDFSPAPSAPAGEQGG